MGSIPGSTPGNTVASTKLDRKAFSTSLFPVRKCSVRLVKKLSQSQPARSREGQSM